MTVPARVVLVRPANPQNLGAVARAMRNLELDDLVLVEPATGDLASARRVAVRAEGLLERARRCRTLDEAVADCAWVVGTSGKSWRGRARLEPSEVAAGALARAPGRTAVVFGGEADGLTAGELDRCHELSAIPAGAAQPSLNLAQAVLIYAWELRRAARSAGGPPPRRRAPAADAELARVEAALRDLLRQARFLAGPERHAVRDLVAVIRRAVPTPREARLWEAALRKVGRALSRAGSSTAR
jgi:tRNA/rRNA methyltransferase